MNNNQSKILFIGDLPSYDLSAAGLRFYSILKILSYRHKLIFYATDIKQTGEMDGSETAKYMRSLEQLGISIKSGSLDRLLMSDRYDAVFMEYYYTAESYLKRVRRWQPKACIFIDSVDVAFHRLFSKAKLTGKSEDFDKAHFVKSKELSVYRQADITIAVTENDKQILLSEETKLHVEVIPNIHVVGNIPKVSSVNPILIFVGTFKHEPNIDGILYFCKEIWPLLQKKISKIQLKIVGAYPTPEILALSSNSIEVTGFVPDTLPYLQQAWVSIAPLRFGAGMKGKIGEAMAVGLPVVTTPVGIEGMSLTNGENVLVADTPEGFTHAIIRLSQDRNLYERISKNGKEFIKMTYSYEVVANKISNIFSDVKKYKRISINSIFGGISKYWEFIRYQANRYLLWRLQ